MEQSLYVYGINVAVAVLKNRRYQIKNLYLKENGNHNEIIALANNRKIPIKNVSTDQLKLLVKDELHQNVVIEIQNYHYYSLTELMATVKLPKKGFFLMLDQINDPHNFGALIRSVDMLGIDGIIILDKRQVQITSTVAKVSSGAFAHVPVCLVKNLTQAVITLKEQGYWIYGTGLNKNAVSVTSLIYDSPICLILGNEGTGVSQKLLTHCDFNIFLPTVGHIDSLNVSVAGALLMYQIKQLQK